jgi:hypothetical protein
MVEVTKESTGLNWPTIGRWLSLIYLVLAIILYVVLGEDLHSFSGLKPNEVGDLLAGLFAPLAFIWLFIATMVQSQELALQRNELQLTRKEFEQSRAVASAQAEEAKRQAENMKVQADVLKEQWEANQKEGLDQLFDRLLDVLDDHLRSDGTVLDFSFLDSSAEMRAEETSDRERFLATYRHRLAKYVEVVNRLTETTRCGPTECRPYAHRFISDAIDLLNELEGLAKRCSRSTRIRATLLNLTFMRDCFTVLEKSIEGLPPPTDFVAHRLRIDPQPAIDGRAAVDE